MSERTPIIILTIVLVVGIAAFVMMMTDAKTGAVSIYDQTRLQTETIGGNPAQYWRQAEGQRAYGAGFAHAGITQAQIIEQTGAPITEGAYTYAGQDAGNLGIVGTSQDSYTKRLTFRQPISNERGCLVYGAPLRANQMGLQYPAGTPGQLTSIRLLECYKTGDKTPEGTTVMVRAAIANRGLTWGAESTACCFSTGQTSTY